MVMIYGEGSFANYRAALAAVGLPSAISHETADAAAYAALLLPGGGDIFGGLGVRETALIHHFVQRRLPILGICRGMQALNVYFGGTLYRRIPHHQQPGGDIVHPTKTEGLMTALLGQDAVVTSNHHQALDAPGVELCPCQWAEDGVVEAVRHRLLPILGVQYHPERQSFALKRPDAADGAPLFAWFAALIRSSRAADGEDTAHASR